jgi:hypothetical protein
MLKAAGLYIGKAAKALVIWTVAATFLCSGLMLCCQILSFQAKTLETKAASCCQSAKADHFKKQDSKSCQCCHLAKQSPDRGHGSFEIAKSSDKSFIHKALSHAAHPLPRIELSSFVDHSPPRAPAVAIYLQLSNLRL